MTEQSKASKTQSPAQRSAPSPSTQTEAPGSDAPPSPDLLHHALTHADPRALTPAVIQNLQSRYGNHFVSRLISHAGQPRIQRVQEGDFQIHDALGMGTADKVTWIYFQREASDLDSTEVEGITAFFRTHKDDALELRGFASEEELFADPSKRMGLIDTRINNLLSLDKSAPTKPRTKIPMLNAGNGKLNYRSWRSVEIAVSGYSAFADVQAEEAAPIEKTPDAETWTAYQETIDKAVDYLGLAEMKLSDLEMYFENSDLLEPNQGDLQATQEFFSKRVIGTLKNNLTAISAHMSKVLNTSMRQMSEHHPRQSTIAFNDDAVPEIWIAPDFAARNRDQSALVLIHEGAHSTPGVVTKDLAYGFERIIRFLPDMAALKNSDNYALFVRALIDANIPYGDTPPTDTITGTNSPDQQQAINAAIAQLQHKIRAASKVVQKAHIDVSAGFFTTVEDLKALTKPIDLAALPTYVGNAWLIAFKLKLLDAQTSKVFNLTEPDATFLARVKEVDNDTMDAAELMPKPPVAITDLEKLAVMYDRMDTMLRSLDSNTLDIQVVDDSNTVGDITWSGGPGNQVSIPRSKLSTKLEENLLKALVRVTPGISADENLVSAYFKLIQNGAAYEATF